MSQILFSGGTTSCTVGASQQHHKMGSMVVEVGGQEFGVT